VALLKYEPTGITDSFDDHRS